MLFTFKHQTPFFHLSLPLALYGPEIVLIIHQTKFFELPLVSNCFGFLWVFLTKYSQ